jgi:hypothetical protein
MSTEKQIEANRANSQLSTGAVTPEGKRKVSINAIKHGYAGRIAIVLDHEKEAYREHFRAFREEYKPVGPEAINFSLAQADNIGIAREINLLGIYENRKMRLFTKTREELLQIQRLRKFNESNELANAASLRQADLLTRQPNEPEWHPSENGFACSIEDIERYIARQKRMQRIREGLNIAA